MKIKFKSKTHYQRRSVKLAFVWAPLNQKRDVRLKDLFQSSNIIQWNSAYLTSKSVAVCRQP